MKKRNRVFGYLVLILLIATFVGCASTSKQEITGEYVDDSVITTKVKSLLAADDFLKSFQISVATALCSDTRTAGAYEFTSCELEAGSTRRLGKTRPNAARPFDQSGGACQAPPRDRSGWASFFSRVSVYRWTSTYGTRDWTSLRLTGCG